MEKSYGALRTVDDFMGALGNGLHSNSPVYTKIVVPHGLKLTDASGREIKSFKVKHGTNGGDAKCGFTLFAIDSMREPEKNEVTIGTCFEFSRAEDIVYNDVPKIIDIGDRQITPLVDFDRAGPVETANIMDPNTMTTILKYSLIRTRGRLTFDIHAQDDEHRYWGPDDGIFWRFTASNNYEVISRSRMDIETDRIWLWGGKQDKRADRSGSMPVSCEESLTKMIPEYHKALLEWATLRMALKYNQSMEK